jgi:hypothetical protein
MWIGLSINKFWEFANKQKMLLSEADAISDFPDKSKRKGNPGIWIKTDDRFNKLGKTFKGFLFFSHIRLTLPLTKEAKESLDQFQNMFPETNELLKRGDA